MKFSYVDCDLYCGDCGHLCEPEIDYGNPGDPFPITDCCGTDVFVDEEGMTIPLTLDEANQRIENNA